MFIKNMEKHLFSIKIIGIVFDPAKRKILIGKGKKDNYHSFIEDNLRYNEELDVGLKRVTTEKTGYKVKNLGAVFARNCLKNKDELHIYFLCEIAGGKERLTEHIEKLDWVSPSKVEEFLGEKLPTRLKEYILNIGE